MKRSIARRASRTRLWFPALNLGLVRPFRVRGHLFPTLDRSAQQRRNAINRSPESLQFGVWRAGRSAPRHQTMPADSEFRRHRIGSKRAPPRRCKTVDDHDPQCSPHLSGCPGATELATHNPAATRLLGASWGRRIPGSVYVREASGFAPAGKEGRASSTRRRALRPD